MEKIQVLFPVPSMRRLRQTAKRQDRPMSEIIRRATEEWLEMQPEEPPPAGSRLEPPTFDLGMRVRDPGKLKDIIYSRGGSEQ